MPIKIELFFIHLKLYVNTRMTCGEIETSHGAIKIKENRLVIFEMPWDSDQDKTN